MFTPFAKYVNNKETPYWAQVTSYNYNARTCYKFLSKTTVSKSQPNQKKKSLHKLHSNPTKSFRCHCNLRDINQTESGVHLEMRSIMKSVAADK